MSTSRDMGYLGNLIKGIFSSLLKGIWDTFLLTSRDIGYWYTPPPPYTSLCTKRDNGPELTCNVYLQTRKRVKAWIHKPVLAKFVHITTIFLAT